MLGMMVGVQPPIADLNMCVQDAEGTTSDGCAKGSHPKRRREAKSKERLEEHYNMVNTVSCGLCEIVLLEMRCVC